MKKLIFLTVSICFLSFPPKTQAVKKVLYSVKSSDSQLELSYGESVMQTFRCQPEVGGIDLKLSGPNDTHFVFGLKPKNAEGWYFEQEFKNISFANRVVYPIGFPPIKGCQAKTWLFEIKSLNQDKTLSVYFNKQNPYPGGEMLYPDIPDKDSLSSNSDLTFRLSSNESFTSQIKNHLVAELNKKINIQAGFWIFYLSLIGLIFYLIYHISTNHKA
jgi:hypothetical protein